jgi:hypothetical protein
MGDTSYGHVILRAVHQHEWDLRVTISCVIISWWEMYPRADFLTSHRPKKSALQGEEVWWWGSFINSLN